MHIYIEVCYGVGDLGEFHNGGSDDNCIDTSKLDSVGDKGIRYVVARIYYVHGIIVIISNCDRDSISRYCIGQIFIGTGRTDRVLANVNSAGSQGVTGLGESSECWCNYRGNACVQIESIGEIYD